MPLSIDNISNLKQYLDGVIGRADHHAQNVNEIVLPLIGAVTWRAENNIEVRTYKGQTANMLWFEIDSKKYAIAYNHHTDKIEIRSDTLRGSVIHEFDNSNTSAEVKAVFENL